MKTLTKFIVGSLLGLSITVAGAVSAEADDCILIICVDAPVVGPIVGGVGDGLDDVLSPPAAPQAPTVPETPAQEPEPVVQPPAAPSMPEPAPWVPATGGNDTQQDSGNESVVVTPTTTPAPSPSPSSESGMIGLYDPNLPRDFDGDGDNDTMSVLSPLTPFVLGALIVLLAAISVSAFTSFFSKKAPRPRR